MAADVTLTTANAAVQAAPTAQSKLSPVEGTPATRYEVDIYTCEDALEAGDKIRVRKVQGGSKILPVESGTVERTTASALTLDIGIYEVAADGSIGTVVDKDILLDGVDVAGGTKVAGTLAPYDVPTTKTEYWIVAEVMAVTGSTAADETIEFYSAINSAN